MRVYFRQAEALFVYATTRPELFKNCLPWLIFEQFCNPDFRAKLIQKINRIGRLDKGLVSFLQWFKFLIYIEKWKIVFTNGI